jgi:hypothetical protein
MVSSIQSIRLMTTQIALKALKEQEESTTSTSSASSSILQQYGLDTSTSSSNDTLTRLLTTLATQNFSSTDDTTSSTTTTVSDDVTTASFMRSLKDSLEEMADTAAGKKQADAMLAALTAGTLTVTDPVSGQKIAAWDVDDENTRTPRQARQRQLRQTIGATS